MDNYGACSDDVSAVLYHKTLKGKKAYTESLGWHLEAMRKDGDEIPKVLRGDYELEFELNTQALLHYFEGVLSRSALARVTGLMSDNWGIMPQVTETHDLHKEKESLKAFTGLEMNLTQ